MFKHNKAQITRYAVFRPAFCYLYIYIFFVLYFLLHPIDNTLVLQYQLVQGCLNYVYIIKKRKVEWRRAHYSKTNSRLTLFYYSFLL